MMHVHLCCKEANSNVKQKEKGTLCVPFSFCLTLSSHFERIMLVGQNNEERGYRHEYKNY